MLAFGPVPSRRLGRSLGINNIPPKLCTYSCVYCQVGRTQSFQVDRRGFYSPEKILNEVTEKMRQAQTRDERIDYLAFVPDGEPTLDSRLGESIRAVKSLGVKTAVITNGSLIFKEDVQRDLAEADWVSIKIDSTSKSIWKKTNRPHSNFKLDAILGGITDFCSGYSGELTTETMLVEAVNDSCENLESIANFLHKIQPGRAYISIPTRPPAEKWVSPPTESTMNHAYQCFCNSIEHVEYLIGYEGDAFASSGNPVQDILSITAVHPMREDAVKKMLSKTASPWSVVAALLNKQVLAETVYGNHKFYVRIFEKLPLS